MRDAQKIRRRPRATGARRPLILIVDDIADQRELYALYLSSRGFVVSQAPDGRTAVEHAVRARPNAIVMDLRMPVLSGWDATRQLKRDARTAHIPIIACTAHVLGGSPERALEAGCDAYLMKPCLPEDLAAAVKRCLGARRARKAR